MTKSRTETQAKSDAKRGLKTKTYKLEIAVIDDIASLSKEHKISQGELIKQAINLWAKQNS